MSTVTLSKTNLFAALKVGSILSETQYYKVEKIVGDQMQIVNDLGEQIVVTESYVNSCLTSGEFFTKEEVKNRTEITQIFLSNPNVAMTVNFNKKVDEKDVFKEIMDTYTNASPKEVEKKFKATIKRALTGEERTIIGRHSGHQDEFGRVSFIDMQLDKGTNPTYDARLRLVDPRTINYLIVKGVKYKVK